MIIWTVQPIAVWQRLRRERILYATSEGMDADYAAAYRWMVAQMRQRLPGRGRRWPWWGWYWYRGKKGQRPDLRCAGHLPRGRKGVRIELDIPDEQVLLSGFDAWHAALNDWYLSLTEADDEQFQHELNGACHDARCPYPEPFRSRVTDSWQRMFDLGTGDPDWRGEPDERSIQATFWTLRLDDVQAVTHFAAR